MINQINTSCLIFFIVFFLIVFPTHSLFSQDKKSNPNWLNEYYPQINLNTDNPPTDLTPYEDDGLEFRRGKGHTFSQVWGRGWESKGVYPKELLPPLFSRKIVFDRLDLKDGELLWVFTGEKAGFTIQISKEKIRLVQRVYDSFGYHNISENKQFRFSRLAEKEFISAEIKYSGKLTSVSISYTHDLKINLYLNEKLVATQMCFFDVTRHQIRYTGKEGVVDGTVLKPKFQFDEIVVNSKKKYQEIIGFGGITSVMAYNELSDNGKTEWWEFLKKYNLLIQREYPNGTKLKEDCSNFDILEDASVHYYGDNFPNGEISDFKYNKQIMDLGGLVIFEFWALPPWAGEDIKDESGQIRQRPIIKKYTEAMVNYCKISKQKTGRPPQIVGIQNERNQPPGVWQNMTLSLRKALDDNEFKDVKIHMYNSGKLSGGIEAAKAFTHKKEVWQAIDYTATNMYDYQSFFLDPDGYDERIREWKEIVQDKPFISTELCINNSKFQHDSYHLALTMGQLYHKNLALMDAKVIMYCWMLLNGPQPSFDGTRSLFKVNLENDSRPIPSSKQLRVFGAFSKHLIKGMRRLEVENSNKDLLVTAYQNGQSKILIILNRSSNPQQVKINWDAATFKNAEIVDTFKENISVNINELFISKNSLEILGGQIITLIE